jgi:DNA-binding MarR family transcriptional regulator
VTDPAWLDDREQRAWRGFLAVNAAVRSRIARQLQQETGLSSADYAVLVSLSEAPGGRLRVFQLRVAADWEKTRLTHQITRMTSRGLVAREPCPDDRRGLLATLTPAGLRRLEEARPTHLAGVRRRFLSHFDERELQTLADAWERVRPGVTA